MLHNLKLLRQEYGISQQCLADAIHVSQPSINKYENHNVEPDLEILARMADYFNTSVDFIIGHTEVRRRIEPTEPHSLNAREMALISAFRQLDEKGKACIETVLHTLNDR